MPIGIPRSLVEFILLGPEDDRRQLQDSPILGDVWVEYAKSPGTPLELLITPYKEQAAGRVASALSDCRDIKDGDVAYLQGIVAARLTFEEVLRFVVPMTSWWHDKRIAGSLQKYQDSAEMEKVIAHLLDAAGRWQAKKNETPMQDVETGKRYIALAGLILWAQGEKQAKGWDELGSREQIARILKKPKLAGKIAAELSRAFQMSGTKEKEGLVWTVSLNRRATPALSKSIPAVKADAARTLFTVHCTEIVWAVVDSGIDATHPAFAGANGACRIRKSFDFTNIREIVSLDNATNEEKRRTRIGALLARALKTPLTKKKAEDNLQKLAEGAREGRSINWELVEPMVEIDPAKCEPAANHGTHVAGILGAARQPAQAATAAANPPEENTDWVDGMCPDIKLYDFRVLAPTLEETEFAIIAALQYIRYLNERNSFMTIHGANLSLSIPHDVRNFACGRTPICNECERLVDSGVVVVAAAGNRGYQSFETKDGARTRATRRSASPTRATRTASSPSARRTASGRTPTASASSRAAGPTGDGRLKPDLVAPGERIRAPAARQAMGRSRRHQHGGAARQRRGGDADGALFRADRPAAADQADPLRERDRPRPRAQLPGPRHARRAARLSEHLTGRQP